MLRQFRMLLDKAGEGQGGGQQGGQGGQGGQQGQQGQGQQGGQQGDAATELANLKAQYAALASKFEALEKGNKGDGKPPEDDDLRRKAQLQREADEKKSGDSKALENALRFQLNSESWLKQNSSLLPKDVSDIFKAADKENYSDAIEKDRAIKSGIIQSFFSIQANADLLTSGQKTQLDDYLKLTKNGKQEKAQVIYDMVFEPAFEMLKRTKKAEALSRGYGSASDIEEGYKQKMMKLSKSHYLGEKSGT